MRYDDRNDKMMGGNYMAREKDDEEMHVFPKDAKFSQLKGASAAKGFDYPDREPMLVDQQEGSIRDIDRDSRDAVKRRH